MISVLVIEDNPHKAKNITEALNVIPGCSFVLVPDLVGGRDRLKDYFDLLVLDINLPERFGETPQKNKGIEFIHELKSSKRLKLPAHIIGLTEYEELFESFKNEFESNLLSLIKYDEKGGNWKNMISDKIKYLIESNLQKEGEINYKYDVAILCALRSPELEEILQLDYQWMTLKIANDSSNYFIGKILLSDSTVLNIVATYLPQMGMVASATTTMKMINSFRPRFILMTGICGGIKGKVDLGDIVVSDLSFDLGSGKIKKAEDGSEEFEPDYRSISLSSEYKESLIDLSMNRDVLRGIKDRWKGERKNGELNLHIGPLASGAAVIANAATAEKVTKFQRKLVAIDMESYSLFYCCEYVSRPKPIPIVIKAVSDYADHEKNDSIQKYCSFVSAQMADYLIKNILKFN